MDRALDPELVRSRRRRRVGLGAGALALTLGSLGLAPALLRPTVDRSRLRTARVERGVLEATLSADGRVLPEVEQVMTSPVDTRVLRVLRRAGDRVRAGEAVLELDLSQARLAVEALDRDLALRQNEVRRRQLDLQSRLADVEGRLASQRLTLDARRAQLARRRELAAAGLSSASELQEAELAEAQAAIELRQLEESRRLAGESNAVELRGLELEAASLRSRRAEAWRELQRGTARAARDGVVTWVAAEEGATVRQGEPVARLADLSAYRVEGSLADVNAGRVAPGQDARVRLGDELLEGRVAAVDPTVRSGVVTFTVALAQKSHPRLRPNLRVDVEVLEGRREGVLRLARGPFASGEGAQEVFVVQGARARRTRVRLGAASATHFEVLEGLAAGDEAVVSDMSAYLHARELRLR